MSFIPVLQIAGATDSQSMLLSVLPFVAIIGIFWFFMIRPQNKKQKEIEKMRASMQKGDHVVTIGGAHGTVAAVREKTVVVKFEEGARIEFDRSAISTVSKSGKNARSEEAAQDSVEEKKEAAPDGQPAQ